MHGPCCSNVTNILYIYKFFLHKHVRIKWYRENVYTFTSKISLNTGTIPNTQAHLPEEMGHVTHMS